MLARLELCPAALGPSRWPSGISSAVLASNRRPKLVSYEGLFQVFWNEHDPTQGMRQGNDRGTQYRSGTYLFSDAQRTASFSRDRRRLFIDNGHHYLRHWLSCIVDLTLIFPCVPSA